MAEKGRQKLDSKDRRTYERVCTSTKLDIVDDKTLLFY